ncbi:DUF1360 domain-containing protein [Candidatus Pacebacteria bacterium]|nr:DUF1360 domain-containing protein [Candidatus Paceibacterota bacterium]
MIRITDQYFWNIVFAIFFTTLTVMATIILMSESYRPLTSFALTDFVLISLATYRLIRLFVYDAITKFFREQFYDVVKVGKELVLEKPERGPRRTLADLMSCPWCMGVWMGATVTFFYALTPYAYFFVVFLAISGVASFLILLSNMVGHRAEQLKHENGD